MMVTGRDAYRILTPFQCFDYLLTSVRFDVGSFFRYIRASKMKIFVNFDLALYFQGHLLQELYSQPQYNHFGENLIKIS